MILWLKNSSWITGDCISVVVTPDPPKYPSISFCFSILILLFLFFFLCFIFVYRICVPFDQMFVTYKGMFSMNFNNAGNRFNNNRGFQNREFRNNRNRWNNNNRNNGWNNNRGRNRNWRSRSRSYSRSRSPYDRRHDSNPPAKPPSPPPQSESAQSGDAVPAPNWTASQSHISIWLLSLNKQNYYHILNI